MLLEDAILKLSGLLFQMITNKLGTIYTEDFTLSLSFQKKLTSTIIPLS